MTSSALRAIVALIDRTLDSTPRTVRAAVLVVVAIAAAAVVLLGVPLLSLAR